jgi:hypothetical protein
VHVVTVTMPVTAAMMIVAVSALLDDYHPVGAVVRMAPMMVMTTLLLDDDRLGVGRRRRDGRRCESECSRSGESDDEFAHCVLLDAMNDNAHNCCSFPHRRGTCVNTCSPLRVEPAHQFNQLLSRHLHLQGTSPFRHAFQCWAGIRRRMHMPIFILWAVPAAIVLAGGTYLVFLK